MRTLKQTLKYAYTKKSMYTKKSLCVDTKNFLAIASKLYSESMELFNEMNNSSHVLHVSDVT